jgi:cytochrome bd-type quinol oxidase subunit 2
MMHSSSDTAVLEEASASPHALWNPVGLACWSIVFTPAFGAWLLMRNWEALDQPAQARACRKWFVFGVGLLVVRMLSHAFNTRLNTESTLLPWVSWLFLAAWWIAAVAPQARVVKSRYGADYPRQGWDHALLLAVMAGTAYWLVSSCFTWLFVALT